MTAFAAASNHADDIKARLEALEAIVAEHTRLLAQSASLFSNWICDHEEDLGEVVDTLDAIRDALAVGAANMAETSDRRRRVGDQLTEDDRDAVLSLRVATP